MSDILSKDYITYCENCANLNNLAYIIHNQYKPLIKTHAFSFSKKTFNKVDVDDFISETYINLISRIKHIDLNKITEPNKFSFYICVRHALSSTRKSFSIKKLKSHYETLELESLEETFSFGQKDEAYDIFHAREQIREMYNICNSAQKKIIVEMYKDPHVKRVSKRIGISDKRMYQQFIKIREKCLFLTI